MTNGSLSPIEGVGSIILSPNLALHFVLFMPNLCCNLLSINKVTRDSKCITQFFPNFSELKVVGLDKVIRNARMCGGLYLLHEDSFRRQANKSSCGFESSLNSFHSEKSFSLTSFVFTKHQVMLWHFRLDHSDFLYLNLFINKKLQFYQCEIWRFAKHTRSLYPSVGYKPSKPFSLIHSDIWGPS